MGQTQQNLGKMYFPTEATTNERPGVGKMLRDLEQQVGNKCAMSERWESVRGGWAGRQGGWQVTGLLDLGAAAFPLGVCKDAERFKIHCVLVSLSSREEARRSQGLGGSSLVVQPLRLYAPNVGRVALISGQVTGLPQTTTKNLHAATEDPVCRNQDWCSQI